MSDPNELSTARAGGRAGPALAAARDAVRRELADLVKPAELPEPATDADAPADAGAPADAAAHAPADADGVDPRPLVLVALSGGPDSTALAAAAAFVAPRLGLRVGAVVVDHQLQPGSGEAAARAARTGAGLGLDPVLVVPVEVATDDGSGPEAAARSARYAALESEATRLGAVAVLLGHTRDDQAESVLLGLLRGSGAASLAGMPRRRGVYRRPFLDLGRSTTTAACAEEGLETWSDPQNEDEAFSRVRARNLLSDLESRLGAGVRAGLARSAELLRVDAESLAVIADAAYAELRAAATDDGLEGLGCDSLSALPPAVRTRVLRLAAVDAGARPADLTSAHIGPMDALVTRWRGQGPVALPGPVHARRDCGRLLLVASVDPVTRPRSGAAGGPARHGSGPGEDPDHPGAAPDPVGGDGGRDRP